MTEPAKPLRGAIMWGYATPTDWSQTAFLVLLSGPTQEAHRIRRDLMDSCEREGWAFANNMLLSQEEREGIYLTLPPCAVNSIVTNQNAYDASNWSRKLHDRAFDVLTAVIEAAEASIPTGDIQNFRAAMRRIIREERL